MAVDGDRQLTCGKGLAENAALPAKLAQLLDARAEVLERHMRALDEGDPAGQRELAAYRSLVSAHRQVAGRLVALADEMAGCQDLPPASHDMATMTDPNGQAAAYMRFQAIQQELVDLLLARRD